MNGISANRDHAGAERVAGLLAGSDLSRLEPGSEPYWKAMQAALRASRDPLLAKVSFTFETDSFSNAIARPSTTLVSALKTASPVAAVSFGSKLNALKEDQSPVRLTAFVARGPASCPMRRAAAIRACLPSRCKNLDAQEDRSALANPVIIAVNAPGAREFKPRPVEIRRLSEWTDVEVLVPDPREGTFKVSVSAGPGDAGSSVQLQVTRPRYALSTAATSILGWGLGTTRITVSTRGMTLPPEFTVPLTVEGGGALDPAEVKLGTGGIGVTTLRSDAFPQAMVKLADPEADAKSVTVVFRAPILFFAAAIAGGLLGAFLRGKGRKKWPRALAIGIASAVLMTVGQAVRLTAWIATALGENTLATSGEAVVFFLGAIAALIGVSTLIPGTARKT